jgi:uncharacterized coiled-coil protein SlyX
LSEEEVRLTERIIRLEDRIELQEQTISELRAENERLKQQIKERKAIVNA